MKSKLLLVLTLFVSSCYLFDSNLPFPKREYGPRVENSIAVTATKGFRKPGTHYVSRGTTVREFLEVAKMLPDPGFHSEGGWWSLKVAQLKNGSPGGFILPVIKFCEKEGSINGGLGYHPTGIAHDPYRTHTGPVPGHQRSDG